MSDRLNLLQGLHETGTRKATGMKVFLKIILFLEFILEGHQMPPCDLTS